MCGRVVKTQKKYTTICNHCHKTLHFETYTKIDDTHYEQWRNWRKRLVDRYSRVIGKYKPELIDLVHSMKNFKVGQIVRMKRVAKFRDSYFHSRDARILTTFIDKIGEIRRIGKMDTRNSEKFIEVRFILPNMKKRDVLCVRRELTDANDEEKAQYMELKECYDAREVAKKL
jgi:hypothetical protein